MKILFLTAEGFDTPNPNNQMAETMIREFLDHGHTVHLVQSRRKKINPDIPESLAGHPGLTVDTVDRHVVDKRNFIRRYFNDVHYAFLAKKVWKKIKDADVVYLQSNPTIVFPMMLLRLFYKKPIVYSIYDVFPGHAYDIGVIRSKFLYNCLKLIQKPCYKWADSIVVLSSDMKRKVVALGADADKVTIVPAWYDVSSFRQIDIADNKFLALYPAAEDKFHVQFAGTIGYVFNYHSVIELAKRLRSYPEIELDIIGDGNVKADFIAEAKSLQLENIKFFPLQPVGMVVDVYSSADIAIIPLHKGVIGNGVPSKAALLMACHKVIVTQVERDSDYSEMFAKNNMGIAVDIDDHDAFAKAVIELYRDRNLLSVMSENSYKYGCEHYSSDRSIGILLDVFDKICGREKSVKEKDVCNECK